MYDKNAHVEQYLEQTASRGPRGKGLVDGLIFAQEPFMRDPTKNPGMIDRPRPYEPVSFAEKILYHRIETGAADDPTYQQGRTAGFMLGAVPSILGGWAAGTLYEWLSGADYDGPVIEPVTALDPDDVARYYSQD